MRKIMTIAGREFRALVGTKAFLVSIAIMPVFMFGGLAAMHFLQNVGTDRERTIAVIDHTGQLFPVLQIALSAVDQAAQEEELSPQGADIRASLAAMPRHRYRLEAIDPGAVDDRARLELSDQIRSQQLYAVIEIPAGVVADDPREASPINFYAHDALFSDARQIAAVAINEWAKAQRLEQAGIDPVVVQQASWPVVVRGLRPLERTAQGELREPDETDPMGALLLPMAAMLLMFMVIFLAAQPMMESVIEEKSQRIAEVLLGSANPTQIMAGKLLGSVGGSLIVFGVYACGALFVAERAQMLGQIPLGLIPWFLTFQILGVLFFSSIFMAVGASVTQLKEAQSLLIPVWLVLMLPLFVWFQVVREPNGPLAVGLSWFPPSTPTMMVLRLATGVTVPLVQVIAALVLLIASTIFCVWLAGRIFRAGLLWQGKTPKLVDLLSWAIRPSRMG